MATRLETVVLTGIYKNQKITARFDRYKFGVVARNMGWVLNLSIDDKTHRVILNDSSSKPCWSVVCQCVERRGKPVKSRAEKRQEDYAKSKRAESGLKIVRT